MHANPAVSATQAVNNAARCMILTGFEPLEEHLCIAEETGPWKTSRSWWNDIFAAEVQVTSELEVKMCVKVPSFFRIWKTPTSPSCRRQSVINIWLIFKIYILPRSISIIPHLSFRFYYSATLCVKRLKNNAVKSWHSYNSSWRCYSSKKQQIGHFVYQTQCFTLFAINRLSWNRR